MIKLENLNHTYKDREKKALNNINLHIEKGESLVIIGSSGSGKSTLLKAINRTIEPTGGKIFIAGEDILSIPNKTVRQVRGRIGMIFQNFNLIERETVMKNVLDGRSRYNTNFRTVLGIFSDNDYEVAKESLQMVGLGGYEQDRVANLSGGQKQRVAMARALSQKPEVILADEPVSNLDPKLMKEIMDLLKKICEEENITLISSLHFLDFAKQYSTRIIGIREGEVVFDGSKDDLTEKDTVDIYGKTKDWYLYGKLGF